MVFSIFSTKVCEKEHTFVEKIEKSIHLLPVNRHITWTIYVKLQNAIVPLYTWKPQANCGLM